MALFGGFPGKKPRTPHAKILKTYVPAVQKEAILGNISALPDIGKLADLYSSQDLARMESALPGYGQGLAAGQSATNALLGVAQSNIQGEVPQDVQDFVRRQAAQQGISNFGYDVPQLTSLTLRDLGRTSYDAQSIGAQQLGQAANTIQAWDSIARRGQLNPASMLVSPSQAISVDQQNRINQYNALQNAYNIQAQPNPLHNVIMGLTEAYLGSMGGGMGGMKGGAPAAGGGTTSSTGGIAYAPSQSYQAAPLNFNYDNQYIPQYPLGTYNPGIDLTNPFG